MKEPNKGTELPQPLAGLLGFALFIAIILVAVVFAKVDDMDQRIEWIKVLGAFGTPLVVAIGLYYTKEALEVNRGALAQTARSVENASKQLLLESRSKTEELFYKASTELSSPSEHARIAALYTIGNLGTEQLEFADRAIDVISAFMRTRSMELNKSIPTDVKELIRYRVTEDMDVACKHLSSLLKDHGKIVNLDGVNLSGSWLSEITLSGASMKNAVMIGTVFDECNLLGNFINASILQDTRFIQSSLRSVVFTENTLRSVRFVGGSYHLSRERGNVYENVMFEQEIDPNAPHAARVDASQEARDVYLHNESLLSAVRTEFELFRQKQPYVERVKFLRVINYEPASGEPPRITNPHEGAEGFI